MQGLKDPNLRESRNRQGQRVGQSCRFKPREGILPAGCFAQSSHSEARECHEEPCRHPETGEASTFVRLSSVGENPWLLGGYRPPKPRSPLGYRYRCRRLPEDRWGQGSLRLPLHP